MCVCTYCERYFVRAMHDKVPRRGSKATHDSHMCVRLFAAKQTVPSRMTTNIAHGVEFQYLHNVVRPMLFERTDDDDGHDYDDVGTRIGRNLDVNKQNKYYLKT